MNLAAVLKFIQEYGETFGKSPTHREIADKFELTSMSHVVYTLRRLERMGKITQAHGEHRSIRVVHD